MDDMRNVKDFLLLFNKLSERCFKRCVYNLGQVDLTSDEVSCVDTCITKNINFNHKLMSLYMEINPGFQQRKMEEQMQLIKEQQAQIAAAASDTAPDQAPPVAATTATPV